MVLLVLGALVATAEAHYPAHGLAGGVGVLAMALGAVLAISGLGAGLALGLLSGLALAGVGGGALLLSVRSGFAVRQRRVRTGAEGLVGEIGVVRSWMQDGGSVALHGSLWQARRSAALDDDDDEDGGLRAGDRVVVERLSGLTLSVRPAEKWELLLMVLAIVIVLAVLLTLGLTTLASSVRVLREYERGVVFRLGRLMDLRGPGLQLLIPTLDRMVRVSLRTVTLTVPPQEIITRDNVPARVTAVAYYRVIDPSKAVTEVESFQSATLQIAQTTLRSVLGVADLDTLLSEREHLNESLAKVIDTQTEPWGIKVTMVEIKDVEIPERMQHAIARQAEAERERRAKIINAEGEFQSAAKLAEAADVMSRNPTTLQLRYLQTLREIGGQQNSTIVFPMPIDLMRPMLEAMGSGAPAAQSESEPAAADPPQLESAPGARAGTGGRGAPGIAAQAKRPGGRYPAQRALLTGPDAIP